MPDFFQIQISIETAPNQYCKDHTCDHISLKFWFFQCFHKGIHWKGLSLLTFRVIFQIGLLIQLVVRVFEVLSIEDHCRNIMMIGIVSFQSWKNLLFLQNLVFRYIETSRNDCKQGIRLVCKDNERVLNAFFGLFEDFANFRPRFWRGLPCTSAAFNEARIGREGKSQIYDWF